MKTFSAAAASLLLSLPAMALPNLSVTYKDSALTVSPTDDIEIWVHVESSTPIDSSLGAPFGFDAADLPKTATVFGGTTPIPFASYTGLTVLPGTSCTPRCDIAGYDYLSWFPSSTKQSFSNLAGSRVVNGDYLVAIYRPKADQLPSGTFTVPVIPSLSFNVRGVSAGGTELNGYLGPVNGFAACSYSKLNSCGMTVTVQAVPEPSSWALMALGLTAVVVTRRRHKA